MGSGQLEFIWDNRRRVLAVAGAFVLGFLDPVLMPLMLSATQAGYVASVEMAGVVTSSMLLGAFIARLSNRTTAVLGCLLMIITNLVSTQLLSFEPLLIIRYACGLGAGAVVTGGVATVAMSSVPERVFGFALTSSSILGAVTLAAAGFCVKQYGLTGLYTVVAVLGILVIPLVLMLPSNKQSAAKKNRKAKTLPHLWLGSLLFTGTIIAKLGHSSYYSFAVTIGENSGLKIEQISSIMALGYFIGIAGLLTAAFIGLRFGRSMPLAGSHLLLGILFLLICLTQNATVFIGCTLAMSLAYLFSQTYIKGLAARLDQWGRWISIVTSATLLAGMIGPTLGGLVIDRYSVITLGWIAFSAEIIGLPIILYVIRQLSVEPRYHQQEAAPRKKQQPALNALRTVG
jgi:predicted MFS family arabinose efflux permease